MTDSTGNIQGKGKPYTTNPPEGAEEAQQAKSAKKAEKPQAVDTTPPTTLLLTPGKKGEISITKPDSSETPDPKAITDCLSGLIDTIKTQFTLAPGTAQGLINAFEECGAPELTDEQFLELSQTLGERSVEENIVSVNRALENKDYTKDGKFTGQFLDNLKACNVKKPTDSKNAPWDIYALMLLIHTLLRVKDAIASKLMLTDQLLIQAQYQEKKQSIDSKATTQFWFSIGAAVGGLALSAGSFLAGPALGKYMASTRVGQGLGAAPTQAAIDNKALQLAQGAGFNSLVRPDVLTHNQVWQNFPAVAEQELIHAANEQVISSAFIQALQSPAIPRTIETGGGLVAAKEDMKQAGIESEIGKQNYDLQKQKGWHDAEDRASNELIDNIKQYIEQVRSTLISIIHGI